MYTSFLLPLLASSLLVAAGPHDDRLARHERIRVVHRRHHARSVVSCDEGNNATTAIPGNGGVLLSPVVNTTTPTTSSCTEGAYQCTGMTLQQCSNGAWHSLKTCSGTNIVCSAVSGATGCVWSWQVPSSTAGSSSTSSPSAAAPSPSASQSAGADDDDDDEDCDEYEDEPTTGNATVSSSHIGQGLAASPTTNKTVNPPLPTHGANNTLNATTTLKLNPTVVTTTVDLQPTLVSNGSLVNATKTITTSVLAPSVIPSRNATAPTGSKLSFSAPHYVVYSDYWLFKMPSVSDLKDFNRFILAFWMSNSGPVDNAQAWAWFTPEYRKQVIAEYHAAGIALMVSAFGSTDAPTSWGMDPIKTAQQLAAYVVQYGFDGVDIDYEDMDAMNSNKAEAWLIPFQIELRRLLPSPYIISHAPVAPWFTSLNVYESGAYVNIHKQVGSTIDFYNIQFYNQGEGVYTDCNTLLFSSGGYWPSTSVFEIHSYTGVPLNDIVIGKPLTADMASNGYMDANSLNQCYDQAKAKGWNAGLMFWEWVDTTAPLMMAVSRGTAS